MSYTDKKITQEEINAHHVQGATDYLIGNPQQNKAVFDNLPEFIAGKHNELIDELNSQHGDEIRVAVDEWLAEHPEVTTTVQDNSLTTAKYVDGSVTEPKIAEGAVTPSRLDREYSTPADLASVNANLTNELSVLDARMDEFASLPPGSTSGNAELLDIRVGGDGITYSSAGDSVRGQASVLKNELKGTRVLDTFIQGSRSTSGVLSPSNSRVTSGMVHLEAGDVITITNNASGQKYVLASTNGLDSGWKTGDYRYHISVESNYFINVAMSDGSSAITPSDPTVRVEIDFSLSIRKNKERIDSINSGHLNTKNLVGMKQGVLYPVNLPAGTPITMSTSDGSAISRDFGSLVLRLELYNENRIGIDYFTFPNGTTQRTASSTRDAYYLAWNIAYPTPIQVEIGAEKTAYVPYYPKIESTENTTADGANKRSSEITREGFFEINSSDEMAWGSYDENGYNLSGSGRIHSADIFIPAHIGDHVTANSSTHNIIVAITDNPYGNSVIYSSGWKRSVDFINEHEGYYVFLAASSLDSFNGSFKVTPYPFVNSDGLEIEEYFGEEMQNTLSTVRNANDEPALVFPWITDIHRFVASVQTYSKMIANIKYLSNEIKCDFILNTGDNIEGNTEKATSLGYAYDIMAAFKNIGLPYFFTEGNHDNNPYYTDGVFDQKECFKAWFTNTKGVTYNVAENGTDYYIDFNNLNVRLVCINSCNVGANNRYAYGTTTANWLRGSALNTNYSVILVEHLSSISEQVWGNTSPTNYYGVTQAIKEFVDSGNTLIQLSGHSHVDLAFADPWLSVMQVCQKFEQADISTSEYNAISGYVDVMGNPERVAGSASEDAWSVCIYKPYSNTLHMVRFGAGVDRIFHVSPISPTTLTTELSGEVTWSSSDESVATVADGVVTAVSTGKCAVLAKDAVGNYECWRINVL